MLIHSFVSSVWVLPGEGSFSPVCNEYLWGGTAGRCLQDNEWMNGSEWLSAIQKGVLCNVEYCRLKTNPSLLINLWNTRRHPGKYHKVTKVRTTGEGFTQ